MTTPHRDGPRPGSERGTSLDLVTLGVGDLMRLHRGALYELHRRGIVRTLNAPQGDRAELLVATAYEGERAPNSQKSWDVLDRKGRRLQVKSRALDHTQVGANTTSPFRSWDFDAAVIVLLNPEDLAVGRAAELPVDVVQDNASSRGPMSTATCCDPTLP